MGGIRTVRPLRPLLLMFLLLAGTAVHAAPGVVIPTGASPKSVTISPDGRLAYVMNLEACSVSVFDVATHKLVRTIAFPQTPATGWDYKLDRPIPSVAEKPVDAAFTDGGRLLWVSLHNASAVFVFAVEGRGFDPKSCANRCVKATVREADGRTWARSMLRIPTGRTPKVIKVSPDGRQVAISNWHGHSVTIVDAKGFRPLRTLKVPSIPRGLAFSKDGRRLYVAIMGGTQVEVFDTTTYKRTAVIANVGAAPRELILDREGRYLYASCNSGCVVTRIDTRTLKPVARVSVGSEPRTIAFSPDEKTIYACCYGAHRLYVIDVSRLRVTGSLPTGENPVGIAVTPDGDIWVTNQSADSITLFPLSKDRAVGGASPSSPTPAPARPASGGMRPDRSPANRRP